MSHIRTVLGIGIDAAEPTFVRTLIEQGALPVLAALERESTWGTVPSPAWIGSGAVWPTFLTGSPPSAHGIHSAWAWRPEAMRVEPVDVSGLRPAWSDLGPRSPSIGLLDVPFSPRIEPPSGFVVNEWGTHDWVHDGRPFTRPAEVAAALRRCGPHPFGEPPVQVWGDLANPRGRREFVDAALRGVRRRGDLALELLREHHPALFLLVFSEVHRASHVLWHAVDPRHPRHEEARAEGLLEALVKVFAETDRQIGRLLEATAADAPVIVFSLHGMRASPGVPELLADLLLRDGLARRKPAGRSPWRQQATSALHRLRGHVPAALKPLYHAAVPASMARRIAGPDESIPAFDWRQTRLFPLPTDQHGWLRVNLRGREAEGIVPVEQYTQERDRAERWLRSLAGTDGRPLVLDVLRTAQDEPPEVLPDLVVHWDEWAIAKAAHETHGAGGVRIRGEDVTGQHTAEGFYLWRDQSPANAGQPLQPQDLMRRLIAHAGALSGGQPRLPVTGDRVTRTDPSPSNSTMFTVRANTGDPE